MKTPGQLKRSLKRKQEFIAKKEKENETEEKMCDNICVEKEDSDFNVRDEGRDSVIETEEENIMVIDKTSSIDFKCDQCAFTSNRKIGLTIHEGK